MPVRDPTWLKLLKLGFLVGGGLLFFRFILHLAAFLGSDIQNMWIPIAGASALFLVFFTNLVKQLRLPDRSKANQPIVPMVSTDADGSSTFEFSGESHAMTEKPKVIIQNPGNVTINNNTTHNNVQGGIIGSGSVTVHQHFEKPEATNPATEPQPVEPVKLIPIKEAVNIDELLAYAETLMGKAMAENTVRNILERAEIESCGEEKRGRARAKTYPREQAEKAISDYIVTNKEK